VLCARSAHGRFERWGVKRRFSDGLASGFPPAFLDAWSAHHTLGAPCRCLIPIALPARTRRRMRARRISRRASPQPRPPCPPGPLRPLHAVCRVTFHRYPDRTPLPE